MKLIQQQQTIYKSMENIRILIVDKRSDNYYRLKGQLINLNIQ